MFEPIREKMLCLMEMNDDLAHDLGLPNTAFWRGLVLQNRESGEITARYRMKYEDRSSWYVLKPKEGTAPTQMKELVATMEIAVNRMVTAAAAARNVDIKGREIFRAHYPPDDNGDFNATFDWLIQQDLIEIKAMGTTEELAKNNLLGKADMIGYVPDKRGSNADC